MFYGSRVGTLAAMTQNCCATCVRIRTYDPQAYDMSLIRLVSYVCGWMGFFQVFQVTTEGGGEKRGTVFRLTVEFNFRF